MLHWGVPDKNGCLNGMCEKRRSDLGLFTSRFYSIQFSSRRKAMVLIRLRACAVWSGTFLFADKRSGRFLVRRVANISCFHAWSIWKLLYLVVMSLLYMLKLMQLILKIKIWIFQARFPDKLLLKICAASSENGPPRPVRRAGSKISLQSRAVWSGPSSFVYIFFSV